MRKHHFSQRYIVLAIVFIIAFGLGIQTVAAGDHRQRRLNHLLRGDYAFSVWRACIQTPAKPGFDPVTRELLYDSETQNFVDSGIMHFNGKGAFEIPNCQVMQLNPEQTSTGGRPMVPGLKSSCEGTYAVNSDRSFIMQGTCYANLPDGTKLTMDPFRAQGHIGRYGLTVTCSENEGTIQTSTLSLNDQVLHESERICATTGTFVKVGRH